MQKYRRSLPPLDSLIFFEAAARHQSFSAAAEELLVTQTAVSKRIRQLEDHLGLPLFLRFGRVITLTDEGRKLAEQSAMLLDFAATALGNVAARPDAPLRIAANTAVSLFWLAPRLKTFGLSDAACPVEMVSSDKTGTLQDGETEIAVLHGAGDWQGRVAIPLFPDILVPIVAAELAQKLGLRAQDTLGMIAPEARPPLLNFRRVTPDWTNWDNWGKAREVMGWTRTDCGTYARSIGAALQGRGIALASPQILAAELKTGQLVQLAPGAQSSRHAYYLTYSTARALRPEAQRLLDFLARTAEEAP